MATNNLSEKIRPEQTPRRSNFTSAIVATAWAANIVLLITTLCWVFGDGRSPSTPDELWYRMGLTELTTGGSVASQEDRWRVTFGMAIGVATSTIVLLSLICGPIRYRSLKSWLLALGLACCWCGLFALWPEFYWKGQKTRLARVLPQATALTARLKSDWPQATGETPELGAFLAYPTQSPTTLLMLGACRLPGTQLHFTSVEKTPDGSIRFGLSGSEPNTWLEWRSDQLPPDSFVGGLETGYTLLRSEKLAANWYLVRYAEAIGI